MTLGFWVEVKKREFFQSLCCALATVLCESFFAVAVGLRLKERALGAGENSRLPEQLSRVFLGLETFDKNEWLIRAVWPLPLNSFFLTENF